MRWIVFVILIPAWAHIPLHAQKIETQKRDSTAIQRVETARGHLTVIELSEPITMVAIGDQNSFLTERRGNRIFVRPTEESAQTNLFVWTASGRYAYELIPARDVAEMHFAIDQEQPPAAVSKLEKPAPPQPLSLPAEMLTKAIPVAVYGERETQGRVEISVRDLYRKDNRLYVRYSLTNRSGHPYSATVPALWQLNGARASQSLLGLSGNQLGERLVRSLKVAGEAPLPVLGADQPSIIDPGANAAGWLIVEAPRVSPDEALVVRLRFAADMKGELGTVVVLGPSVQPAAEVTHAGHDADAQR